MFCPGNDSEVCNMIIKWISVNMVDNLGFKQFSSYAFRHNKTVFNNSGPNSIAGCFYGYGSSFIMTFACSKIRMVFTNTKFVMASIRAIFSRARPLTVEILSAIRTYFNILFVCKLPATLFRAKSVFSPFQLVIRNKLNKKLSAIIANIFFCKGRRSMSLEKIMPVVRMPRFRNNIFTTSTFAFHIKSIAVNSVTVNLFTVKF